MLSNRSGLSVLWQPATNRPITWSAGRQISGCKSLGAERMPSEGMARALRTALFLGRVVDMRHRQNAEVHEDEQAGEEEDARDVWVAEGQTCQHQEVAAGRDHGALHRAMRRIDEVRFGEQANSQRGEQQGDDRDQFECRHAFSFLSVIWAFRFRAFALRRRASS